MPKPNSAVARLTRAIDAIVLVSGKAVAWLILPMVLSLVWEVTARYGFNAPTEWAYDMTFMLYGTFFMLGSAWTLQRGGHIRTDSFYSNWSKRTQARVDLVCYLVFFFPAMAIFAWLGVGVLLEVVPAERADRHQPVAADRLAVQVHDAARRRAAAAAGHLRVPESWGRAFGPGDGDSEGDPAGTDGEVTT